MRKIAPALMVLLGLALLVRVSAASELDLIPQAVLDGPAPAGEAAPSPARAEAMKASLQAAGQGLLWREGVPLPAPDPERPDARARLSFDLRGDWDMGSGFRAVLANRLDATAAQGRRPEEDDAQNSLREAFVSFAAAEGLFFDLGRINQKDGVAQGFNPADRFAAHAVKVRVSEDPTVLRDARLGTVMLRGQKLWDGGALLLAYAPRLDSGQGQREEGSFDLGLDRTNRRHLGLVRVSQRLAEDLQPELIVSQAEGERPEVSLSLTRAVGDALVLTGEWSGGWRRSLAGEALADGVRTGTVPTGTPLLGPGGEGRRWRNRAALGASLTTADNLTVTLEYHYDQGAPGRDDWRRWTREAQSDPLALAQFWLMRRYGEENGLPGIRHSLFLRGVWENAFTPDLDVTLLARVSPYDGSAFLQLAGDYYLTSATTLTLRLQGTPGHDTSVFGSLPQAAAATLEVTRHF